MVVGDFNDWSTEATPMVHDGETFVADILLTAGRAYRYRYLLDGDRWENDWHADDYVPNEFGGDDSVVDLRDRPCTAAQTDARPDNAPERIQLPEKNAAAGARVVSAPTPIKPSKKGPRRAATKAR